VREFESAVQDYLEVNHAIAVANGTLSLVLLLKSLGCTGKAVIPSFTYIATAHAVVWAGLSPVFADIDPDTYNITAETIEAVLTPDVSVVVPVHVFGVPADVAGIQALADRRGLRVAYDSAHAFGSATSDRKVGCFGCGESFSLHATKALPVGEGGLVTTQSDELACWLRAARVFGDYGDHDTAFPGLNAKMTEFSALLGLEGLKNYPETLRARANVANLYRRILSELPGLEFQSFAPGSNTTYQNFSVLVNPDEFGLNRDELCQALAAENIMARKYFWPPVHRHKSYAFLNTPDKALPVTDRISSRILCLPMHPGRSPEVTSRVAEAICGIWEWRSEIRYKLRNRLSEAAS
jgi:dTDP-4-amino-4,6-dideoxygalactose transaminase